MVADKRAHMERRAKKLSTELNGIYPSIVKTKKTTALVLTALPIWAIAIYLSASVDVGARFLEDMVFD
jgi:hypothetical protein